MKVVHTPLGINCSYRFVLGIVFLLLFTAGQLFAQQPVRALTFHSFGIDQGLSQGFVSDIMQDRRGFMWFTTGDGLNRYDGYKFIVYHHDPDNPQSIISDDLTCVFQDSKDRIWVGSRNNGLDLFNPETNTFQHFQHSGKASLRSNNIIGITEDKNGILWVRTRDGIDIMQVSTENNRSSNNKHQVVHRAVFKPIKIDNETEISKRVSGPEQIFIDSHNRIFITTSQKIWQLAFNAKKNTYKLDERFRFKSADPTFVPELIEDKVGGKLLLVSKDILQFADYEFNNPQKIYDYDPYQIRTVIDKSHNLWLSKNSKITSLDLKTRKIQTITSNIPAQVLAMSSITNFYCDKSGVVWIATGGFGLLKHDPEAELFHHILPGKAVYQLLTGNNNTIFTSNFEKIKLIPHGAPEISEFLNFTSLKKLYPKININSISKDRLDNIYLGVNKHLLKYNILTKETTKIELPYQNMDAIPFPIYCDKDNNVWMGYRGQLVKYDPVKQKLSKFEYPSTIAFYDYDFLQFIYQDGDMLWLGSTNGLFTFDIDKERMSKSYFYNINDVNSLSNNYILSITNDYIYPDKYLWVGTKGGGLNRLDKQTGKFSKFNNKNGLPNNVIYGILPDDHGKLWISTNKGISKFDPILLNFQNFDIDDGLQSNEFNRYAYGRTGNGLLVFGGMNGINYFDPNSIKPLPPPAVVFTEFRLFNKPVISGEKSKLLKVSIDSSDEIQLRYDQNVLTFQFAAMDYRKPGNLRYRYRMDGFDKDYIYAGIAREATYSNLDPGEYNFKVQANYGTKNWGKTHASIKLIIIAPWYKTWWFYTLSIVTIIAFFYGLHLFRLAQLGRVNTMRNRIARDLHDEVGSSLSTIAIYSKIVHEQNSAISFNKEPLLRKITDNATEIMESMSDIVWNIHDKNDAFENILSRMREQAYQLFEAKGYIIHFDFDEGLLKRRLSMEKRRDFYLIYKEALNNVAKYACGQNIWISLCSQNNLITLKIRDDGKGFDPLTIAGGNGLANMQHRAGSLQGKLKIFSVLNQGTIIELSF